MALGLAQTQAGRGGRKGNGVPKKQGFVCCLISNRRTRYTNIRMWERRKAEEKKTPKTGVSCSLENLVSVQQIGGSNFGKSFSSPVEYTGEEGLWNLDVVF